MTSSEEIYTAFRTFNVQNVQSQMLFRTFPTNVTGQRRVRDLGVTGDQGQSLVDRPGVGSGVFAFICA